MSMLWHPFNEPGYHGLMFHVDNNFEWGSMDLRIATRDADRSLRGLLTWEETTPGDSFPPTLRCKSRPHGNELQHLFNALWEAGFRPPKMNNASDVIAAKDANLEDLRKIIFSPLE